MGWLLPGTYSSNIGGVVPTLVSWHSSHLPPGWGSNLNIYQLFHQLPDFTWYLCCASGKIFSLRLTGCIWASLPMDDITFDNMFNCWQQSPPPPPLYCNCTVSVNQGLMFLTGEKTVDTISNSVSNSRQSLSLKLVIHFNDAGKNGKAFHWFHSSFW